MPTGLAAEKNLKRTSGTLGWYNCRRTAVVLHDAFESYTATFRAKPFGCKRYLHKCMITNNTFVIRPVCAPVSVLVRVKVFAADCSPLESRLHTLIHQPRYCFVQAASTWGEWYTTWETTGIVCVCVCACVSDIWKLMSCGGDSWLNCVEMDQMMKWSQWTIQLSVYAWLFNHRMSLIRHTWPKWRHRVSQLRFWPKALKDQLIFFASTSDIAYQHEIPALQKTNGTKMRNNEPDGQGTWAKEIKRIQSLGLQPFSSQTSTQLASLFEGLSKAFALGHFFTSGKIHQG